LILIHINKREHDLLKYDLVVFRNISKERERERERETNYWFKIVKRVAIGRNRK